MVGHKWEKVSNFTERSESVLWIWDATVG